MYNMIRDARKFFFGFIMLLHALRIINFKL